MILHSPDTFPGTHGGSNLRIGIQNNSETGVHSHAINNTQVLPFTPSIICLLYWGITDFIPVHYWRDFIVCFLNKKNILSCWMCWAMCSEISWYDKCQLPTFQMRCPNGSHFSRTHFVQALGQCSGTWALMLTAPLQGHCFYSHSAHEERGPQLVSLGLRFHCSAKPLLYRPYSFSQDLEGTGQPSEKLLKSGLFSRAAGLW